jgi:hypothetical protein
MLTLDTLDAGVQRNVTRFTIERFLQELGEQFGPPDQWQMAAANSAIAAYQRGEFDHALRCISVGEKPPHQRPLSAPFTIEVGKLSLRSLWSCLIYPSSDFPAASDGRVSFSSPGTGTHVHTK